MLGGDASLFTQLHPSLTSASASTAADPLPMPVEPTTPACGIAEMVQEAVANYLTKVIPNNLCDWSNEYAQNMVIRGGCLNAYGRTFVDS